MTPDDQKLTDQLWKAVVEVCDPHPRVFNDAPTDEVVAAVLPLIAAEVQAAKAEALRNLPPHLSLQIHQCKAREGGGSYCALEKGHSGDHRILGVPDEWVLGAADRYIEQIETGDQA